MDLIFDVHKITGRWSLSIYISLSVSRSPSSSIRSAKQHYNFSSYEALDLVTISNENPQFNTKRGEWVWIKLSVRIVMSNSFVHHPNRWTIRTKKHSVFVLIQRGSETQSDNDRFHLNRIVFFSPCFTFSALHLKFFDILADFSEMFSQLFEYKEPRSLFFF